MLGCTRATHLKLQSIFVVSFFSLPLTSSSYLAKFRTAFSDLYSQSIKVKKLCACRVIAEQDCVPYESKTRMLSFSQQIDRI